MRQQYKTWLPSGALSDGTNEASLAESVEIWCEGWSSRTPDVRLEPIIDLNGTVDPQQLSVWHNEAFAIGLDARAKQNFGLELLAIDPGKRKLGSSDAKLLSLTADKAIADLQHLICEHYDLSKDVLREDGEGAESYLRAPKHKYYLFLNDQPTGIHLSLHSSFAIELRRAALDEPDSEPELSNLSEAMLAQNVTLTAKAGESNITLAEAENLSVGDVIVLDKNLTDLFSVAINGALIDNLTCRMTQGKSDKSLKLTHIEMSESRE